MNICLYFVDSISEAYQQKLQTIQDGYVAQGLTENRAPYFKFPGMNQETANKISELRREYNHRERSSYLRKK